jgi:photosystem II stability/assembly factor-like uncharacterized protein
MRRRLIASPLALVLLVLLLASTVAVGRAQAPAQVASAPPDWERTDLTAPSLRLFPLVDGALLTQAADALLRSDDAGLTWRVVPLGPATSLLAVDPSDPTTLYAAGPDGVYKTTDDAVTWEQSLAYGPEVGGRALALAASPADPSLLYLGVAGAPDVSSFRFFRSRDGGATWQQLEERHFSLCTWTVRILQAHPTDARRVVRAADCIAGRNFGETLAQSIDMGETWTPLFNPEPFQSPFLGYPAQLVGGRGLAPRRFYLAVNRDRRLGGSSLVRSDDGATWSAGLAYPGGVVTPGESPNVPDVQLGGLAYAPGQPDHVYVGRQVFPSYFAPASGGAVIASLDGGKTWHDLGRQDIGAVTDLVLGGDGGWLFAATDQGLWRLRVGTRGM